MRFKDWNAKLDEIQHVSFPALVIINDYQCDGIDFKFEYWKTPHPDDIVMPNPQSFFSGHFSAELENGFYLNCHRGKPASIVGNLALKTQPKTEATINKEPLYRILPEGWFYYAELYLDMATVKPSKQD